MRLSKWNKREDVMCVAQNKKPNPWGCFAKTIIITDDKARNVIEAYKEIEVVIRSGISYVEYSRLSEENYCLYTRDPYGLSFEMNWGNTISLPVIENKIEKLQKALDVLEEKNEDYRLMFYCDTPHIQEY